MEAPDTNFKQIPDEDMSAPTPAPGDESPREGYYPDPSIPGYVRYWNGSAWVPGTSRPAPSDGRPLPPPPGVHASGAAARPAVPLEPDPAPLEETGPQFFDEDSVQGVHQETGAATGTDLDLGIGAEAGAGVGADGDYGVSWPVAGRGTDPRLSRVRRSDAAPDDRSGRPSIPSPAPEPENGADDGTYIFRRPSRSKNEADDGTALYSARSSRTERNRGGAEGQAGSASASPSSAAAAQGPAYSAPAGPQRAGDGMTVPHQANSRTPAASSWPRPAHERGAPGAMSGAGVGAGVGSGVGAGSGSRAGAGVGPGACAGGEEPVAPWKPPVEDPFQAIVRRRAAARPAALGKRLVARLVDTVVLGAVTAAVAVPVGTRAMDHVQDKIDEAKLSGKTVTVWLVDGSTLTSLGLVLATLLVAGILLEALPTAKWGRTLGKKLCGLQVRDIEAHEPPSFGKALRRWLVYCVPGLLVVGIVGVAWCITDRPWRQCWHDKAAHTFVAG